MIPITPYDPDWRPYISEREIMNLCRRGGRDSAALRHNCGTIRRSRAEGGARKLRKDNHATVAELVDAQDLGSCGATRGGSSPSGRIAHRRP